MRRAYGCLTYVSGFYPAQPSGADVPTVRAEQGAQHGAEAVFRAGALCALASPAARSMFSKKWATSSVA